MAEHPLGSLADYSYFVAEALNRPSILQSTIRVWSTSPFTGTAEGEATFSNGLRLRMREELNFADGLITSYGYEVYRGTEHLYWYDDFPHPDESSLGSTSPYPSLQRRGTEGGTTSFFLPFVRGGQGEVELNVYRVISIGRLSPSTTLPSTSSGQA